MRKQAKANVSQIRQQTQYTCCSASIASALTALDKPISEEDVNKVLDATPMSGASWESILACVQYFGCRGTLIAPCTPLMLKEYTDKGIPLIIGWNFEGRPWSHASVVFDVTEEEDGLYIHVMDPNIPNPSQTTRKVHEDLFCQKWSEKLNEKLILRRPAMAIEREVSSEGKQMKMATAKTNSYSGNPGGKPIYPNEIDHGTDTEPLGGGFDVMRRLQNGLLHEQGDVVPQRPISPQLAGLTTKVAIEWIQKNTRRTQ